ncbi:hypothetical protein DH86_00003288, partial [Scytalidium sp. 3C]
MITRKDQLVERELRRMQELLKSLIPGIDVDDPNLDAAELRKLCTSATQKSFTRDTSSDSGRSSPVSDNSSAEEDSKRLETILELTGTLDLDENGNWDYHGHSSGSLFLWRLGEQFRGLHNNASTSKRHLELQPTLRATMMLGDPFSDGYRPALIPLPPKETALDLASSTLDDACALMNFVHQGSFYTMFNR